MYTIPYIESEEFFYLDVFLKLLLGLLALALIINKSGKGNYLSVCYRIGYLGIPYHRVT